MSTASASQGPETRISVVVPVFQNQGSIAELHRRLSATLGDQLGQMIFVDDASRDRSAAAIDSLTVHDPRVERLTLARNGGQHRAVLHGLDRSHGAWTVVMDADLQDPPEAIPALIERATRGADVVFAARRGVYEPPFRLLTARLFKRLLAFGCGLPADAGMFFVCNRLAIQRLRELAGPPPYVVAMIGRADLRIDSLPVRRRRRPGGGSSCGSTTRIRHAASAMRWLLRRPPLSGRQRALHNIRQREYYAHPEAKPNMHPRRSRYLARQIDEVSSRAGLREGERVLEVGCGMGRHTLMLAERALRVEAIDISTELLDRLRRVDHARAIVIHEGDILEPPASVEGSFDAVVGFFVLHHLHDVAASMRAIARLLRPGGRVAFLEPNAFNPAYYVQIAAQPSMTWKGDRGVIEMRRRLLLRAASRAGLVDARCERFGLLPPQLAERPRAARIERQVERISPLRPALAFQILTAAAPGTAASV